MNNVDTNHTPHNIPLTGNYSQQFNLNLNVKFCYYRDVLYYKTQEWFDGEISEVIAIRNQQYKKFKKTLRHVDKEIFKETKYKVIKMIKSKKNYILKENLMKTLLSLKSYGRLLNP